MTDYAAGIPVQRERPASAVFGQVMGLVALSCGACALGVYAGRNLGGSSWFIPWIGALACFVGLNFAVRRSQGLAVLLLFAAAFLLGLSVASTIVWFAQNEPTVVWQAAGATGLTVAAMGSIGFAIRRDLSYLYRGLFFALLGLIAVGFVLIILRIPAAETFYALAGIGIFSAYTLVDFNRLRRAGTYEIVPLAAGIFLDVFNLFLFFLQLFGTSRN